jgi:hypothetical protein
MKFQAFLFFLLLSKLYVLANEYRYKEIKCSSSNRSFAVMICSISENGTGLDLSLNLKEPMDKMNVIIFVAYQRRDNNSFF